MLSKLREGNPIWGWLLGDGRKTQWFWPVQSLINLACALGEGDEPTFHSGSDHKEVEQK